MAYTTPMFYGFGTKIEPAMTLTEGAAYTFESNNKWQNDHEVGFCFVDDNGLPIAEGGIVANVTIECKPNVLFNEWLPVPTAQGTSVVSKFDGIIGVNAMYRVTFSGVTAGSGSNVIMFDYAS